MKLTKNQKLLCIWVAILAMMVMFITHDACELRSKNPELESNAYFLNCNTEKQEK